MVAAPDGFPKLPDFWLRMDFVWKPVVELVVTIPVVAVPRDAGPAVTTLTAHALPVDGTSGDDFSAIGGMVRAGAPAPAGGGRLGARREIDRMVNTNAAGQFLFSRLAAGAYTLEAGSVGHPAVSRAVQVPSPTGEYDLYLS